MYGRDVNADLLENTPMHDGHDAAAALAFITLPRCLLETTGRAIRERSIQLVLQLFKSCANLVTQLREPGGRCSFLVFKRFWKDGGNIGAVHGKESFLTRTVSHQLKAKRKGCLLNC